MDGDLDQWFSPRMTLSLHGTLWKGIKTVSVVTLWGAGAGGNAIGIDWAGTGR